ncbi:MAG TPA: hypothetical protein VFY93_07155 [Planctomycetota bacterium]|nr:hypothetical protein [Planctomycetota bacterium]
MSAGAVTGLWTGGFMAALGLLHLLLPDLAYRWRAGMEPNDTTRRMVRALGAALLGLAALVVALAFILR